MKSPITIDCQYIRPQFAAAFLIQESKKALFIENNTSHSVPILLAELARQGLTPNDVEYLIITHVHLDHAGGSAELMNACPRATLLAHPKAAIHAIDPSKLVSSAKKVYGDSEFERLYGQIGKIEASRVRSVQDGEILKFGSRELQFLFTRGHANHHICIFDSGSKGIFTGDSFGLAYPALQSHGLFIFPSTSPTDFDAIEAKKSIEKITQSGAQSAYLTHFGEVKDLSGAAQQLISHLNFCEELLDQAVQNVEFQENLEVFCHQKLNAYFKKILESQGFTVNEWLWNYLQLDIELNAAGIAYAARRKRSSMPPA
jgi:glyoxylase-like metal-dependent hydrolase (beta-lactamase superfamily II)